MSTPNDGGAAFPVPPERTNVLSGGDVHWTYAHPGMTLRDYFAAAAMQGLSANPAVYLPWQAIVEEAYATADKMLAERSKTKEPQS